MKVEHHSLCSNSRKPAVRKQLEKWWGLFFLLHAMFWPLCTCNCRNLWNRGSTKTISDSLQIWLQMPQKGLWGALLISWHVITISCFSFKHFWKFITLIASKIPTYLWLILHAWLMKIVLVYEYMFWNWSKTAFGRSIIPASKTSFVFWDFLSFALLHSLIFYLALKSHFVQSLLYILHNYKNPLFPWFALIFLNSNGWLVVCKILLHYLPWYQVCALNGHLSNKRV